MKIVLYGTGKFAEQVYEYVKNKKDEYQIVYVVDSNSDKIDDFFYEHKICKIETIKNIEYDCILLCAHRWEGMLKNLYENNYDLNKVKCWDGYIKELSEVNGFNIFSQDGEELFLKNYFCDKKNGNYIDVGAYHPYKFSNTAWAYIRGWRGINIEPNLENYVLFKALRPEDINLNCGIGEKNDVLKYYTFEEGALNTFDKNRADSLKNEWNYKGEVDIEVKPLKDIISKSKQNYFDFIDIDVENCEMNVLRSIDFSKVELMIRVLQIPSFLL